MFFYHGKIQVAQSRSFIEMYICFKKNSGPEYFMLKTCFLYFVYVDDHFASFHSLHFILELHAKCQSHIFDEIESLLSS